MNKKPQVVTPINNSTLFGVAALPHSSMFLLSFGCTHGTVLLALDYVYVVICVIFFGVNACNKKKCHILEFFLLLFFCCML